MNRVGKGKPGVKQFLQAHAWLTRTSYNKLDGTCDMAMTYARAAYRIATIVDAGQGSNGVFIQYASLQRLKGLGQTRVNIRIGDYPDRWQLFSGRTW